MKNGLTNKTMEEGVLKALMNVFPQASKEQKLIAKKRSEFENWDSLNHMQLVSEIETLFGVSFSMDEIASIERPKDFIELIKKKGA